MWIKPLKCWIFPRFYHIFSNLCCLLSSFVVFVFHFFILLSANLLGDFPMRVFCSNFLAIFNWFRLLLSFTIIFDRWICRCHALWRENERVQEGFFAREFYWNYFSVLFLFIFNEFLSILNETNGTIIYHFNARLWAHTCKMVMLHNISKIHDNGWTNKSFARL